MAQEPNESWYSPEPTEPEESAQTEPETEQTPEPPVHQWQQTKEKWYDHLNVTVHQLDIIIYCALGALAVVFVLIALDAMNIIG